MKNLKMILGVFLMIGFAMSLNAQTTIGLRGGITLANYDENPMSYPLSNQEMKFMTGVDVALFSNIEIVDMFSIQPELHYVQKGVKITGKSTTDNMEGTITERFDYLELPVLARLNFMNAEENVFFHVFVGPSVGYALSGKFKGENYSFNDEGGMQKGDFTEDITWDDSYDNDGVKDNRWDFGAAGGVGVEFLAGPVNVVVDARYTMDFLDRVMFENSAPNDHDKVMNRGFSFTAGIAFPIGGR